MGLFKKPVPATTPRPAGPVVGSLMIDRSNNNVLVYDGNSWRPIDHESWEDRVNRLAVEYPSVAAAKQELELQMALVHDNREQ